MDSVAGEKIPRRGRDLLVMISSDVSSLCFRLKIDLTIISPQLSKILRLLCEEKTEYYKTLSGSQSLSQGTDKDE